MKRVDLNSFEFHFYLRSVPEQNTMRVVAKSIDKSIKIQSSNILFSIIWNLTFHQMKLEILT